MDPENAIPVAEIGTRARGILKQLGG